ncbi:MAG: hypothetical protein LBD23_04685 [Oscillospiraceae bacterium]|jgi:hypothetical protein|nr:hypothetical protein [Oscillospiraceae bacterium]
MERKIDRFDKYMEFRRLNDNMVTREVGFSIGMLGKSRKEGKDLTNKSVEKILKRYLDLNRKWLISGENEMLNNTSYVEDPPVKYGICRECAEKENETKKLKDRISFLNESIREYKGEASDKDQQIGRLKSILEQYGISND